MSLTSESYAKGGSVAVGAARAVSRAAPAIVRSIPRSTPKVIPKAVPNISKNFPSTSAVRGVEIASKVVKPANIAKAVLFMIIAGCVSERIQDCTEGVSSDSYGDISAREYERE
jgi:hypothetical protein